MDVIIGTEEEFIALLDPNPVNIMEGKPANHAQRESLPSFMADLLNSSHTQRALVLKRSERGVSVYRFKYNTIHKPGYKVEVINTVGAGDAFASG
jgi:sugar/nucleoside kinase (ribokinase family)